MSCLQSSSCFLFHSFMEFEHLSVICECYVHVVHVYVCVLYCEKRNIYIFLSKSVDFDMAASSIY